jgi:hypothetical protein
MWQSAQYIGHILLSASRLRNEIFPEEKKVALYTAWVRGLQPEHHNNDYEGVMKLMLNMFKNAASFPQAEKKLFAQQALSAIARLSEHKDIQRSYRNEVFMQCVALSLENGAVSSKLKDAPRLLQKLISHKRCRLRKYGNNSPLEDEVR